MSRTAKGELQQRAENLAIAVTNQTLPQRMITAELHLEAYAHSLSDPTPQHQPKQTPPAAVEGVDELRKAILLFDKSRGETGTRAVTGKMTKKQADERFEADIATLLQAFAAHQQHQTAKAVLDARIDMLKHLQARTTGFTYRVRRIAVEELADLQNQRNALDKETV